jgi:hypothetical protein
MVMPNRSVLALVGVLLCCLFAKIEATARAAGEATAPGPVIEGESSSAARR